MTVTSSEPVSAPATLARDSSAREERFSATARIVRNVLALGAGQLLTWTSSTVLAVILPRYLGDENLGAFTLAQSFTALFGLIVGLGTATFLTKEVARRNSEAGQDVLNGLFLRLPLALIVGAVVVLAAHLLQYDAYTRKLIYLFWLNTMLLGMAGVLIGTLQGMQEMRPVALITGLGNLFGMGLTAVVLARGYSAVGVAAMWNISMSVVVVAYLIVVFRHGGLRGRLRYRSWLPLLGGGLPFLIWEVSLFTYGQIDIFLLSLFTRSEVIGWYGAAYRIVSIPVFIPAIVVAAVFPALTVAASKQDWAGFRSLASGALHIVLFGTIPIALGAMVLAPALIKMLGYPHEFDRSVPLITILAIHIPLMGADMVIGTALNSLDRQRVWAFTALAAAVLNPSINAFLIPFMDRTYENGAIGAATATVLTELFMAIMGLRLLRGEVFSRSDALMAAKCLLAGGVMVGAVWPFREMPIALGVAVGAVSYGLASVALGTVSSRELRLLRSYVFSRATGRPAPVAAPAEVAT